MSQARFESVLGTRIRGDSDMERSKNLPYVFSRLPADVHEVIVVDGHSVDDTMAVGQSAAARGPGSAADSPGDRPRYDVTGRSFEPAGKRVPVGHSC